MKKAVKHSLTQRAAALALVALTLGGVSAAAAEKSVATVNGVAIPQSLMDAYTKHRPPSANQGEAVVNELVAQELLVQEAKRRGIDKNPMVRAEIEVLKRGVLAGNAIKAYLEEHPVSEADMKAEYKRMVPNLASDEYKARHILLKTEDEAKAVIADLKKGGDFVALARKKSTGPSAKNGGDLGWFNPAQMVPPFAEAVKGMKKGAYSAAPVQTQFGWHVILLEDTRTKPAPSYEQVKPQLAAFMKQKATQDYIKSLEEKAKIER
jgi:peptidyl-prolyl cis-trans isomerase C